MGGEAENATAGVFRASAAHYNKPGRIVTFGAYLGNERLLDAHGQARYAREAAASSGYQAGDLPVTDDPAERNRAIQWTRLIAALNAGRKWPLDRLTTRFGPLLASGIAIAVVPSHDPFHDDPPLRELARRLAAEGSDRIDATGCLVRHTKIKRIVWGGPSYRSLHRSTIALHEPERIAGHAVLLLDDVARSGASLRACEELLYEAGATLVQMVALGRVY